MKSQTDKRIDGIPLGDTGLTIFFGNVTPTPLSDGVKEGDVWFVTLSSASSGNTEFECAYQYRNGDWVNVGYFPDTGVGEALGSGNERFTDYENNSISSNSSYSTVFGYHNTIGGHALNCFAAGNGNAFSGYSSYSFITGAANSAETAYGSIVAGNHNSANGNMDNSAIFGSYNEFSPDPTIDDEHTAANTLMCGNHNFPAPNALVGGAYSEKTYEHDYPNGIGLKIGIGSSAARRNGLIFEGGDLHISGTLYQQGADYAETYEWFDGNPKGEDRRGLFVTLDGDRIIPADGNSDYILGVISACPTVCGDTYDLEWHGKFRRDVFGETVRDESGGLIVSDEFDPERRYIPQSKRPEKAFVGTHGKLVVRDDGTCKINGYCRPTSGGIATASAKKTDYRVIERRDENHIRIVIK